MTSPTLLADPTSPIPFHCASIVVTSTVRVTKNKLHLISGNHDSTQTYKTLVYLCVISVLCNSLVITNCKKATIYKVTAMLSTSENVLFPGHHHLLYLTTGAEDPSR